MNGAQAAQLPGIEAALDDRHEVDIAAPVPVRAQAHRADHVEPLHPAGQRSIHASQEIVDPLGYRRRKPMGPGT